jgi:hypothetical protein
MLAGSFILHSRQLSMGVVVRSSVIVLAGGGLMFIGVTGGLVSIGSAFRFSGTFGIMMEGDGVGE